MKVSNRFFISGGADGTLQIRSLDNFNSVKNISVFGWKNGNLFTGAVSDVDGLYYACGKDGALCMWKTKDL
jgi:WD40 repeat protein